MPLLNVEFTWFGKVGKTEVQEPLCTLMLFLPFPGHSAVAGTAKEAHTRQRCSQKVFALLLPKLLAPRHSLCLPVISRGKEKREKQEANITCHFQRRHSTAAGISRHTAGHAPLHKDRSETRRETITLRGEETSA